MNVSGKPTKRATLIEALDEYARRAEMQKIKQLAGSNPGGQSWQEMKETERRDYDRRWEKLDRIRRGEYDR